MNDLAQTMILEWMVGGLVSILLVVVAFSIRRWVTHVDGLQASLDRLQTAILTLSEKFVTRDQHDRDMEALRVFGRRAMDHCPEPNCPHERRMEI